MLSGMRLFMETLKERSCAWLKGRRLHFHRRIPHPSPPPRCAQGRGPKQKQKQKQEQEQEQMQERWHQHKHKYKQEQGQGHVRKQGSAPAFASTPSLARSVGEGWGGVALAPPLRLPNS